MLLRICSDIHLEFGDFSLPALDTDSQTVLVLAGDLHVGLKGEMWLRTNAPRFKAVIYVHGNHESYNYDIIEVRESWRTKDIENVYFLDSSSVTIDGYKFMGDTLWTNMHNSDPTVMWDSLRGMNDYRIIRKSGFKLIPEDTIQMFNYTMEYLTEEIRISDPSKTIIVTHHLPSYQSISNRYRQSALNGAYATDLEPWIVDHHPKLWIHGHVHASFDYQIGDTRIVCNPFGYKNHEENPNFNPNLVIEL